MRNPWLSSDICRAASPATPSKKVRVVVLKSELVQRLAARNSHLYQRDIENIINAIVGESTQALERGDRVELRGFGAFSTRQRKARDGHNPRTGEYVAVSEKQAPFFRAGKAMRDRLNRQR